MVETCVVGAGGDDVVHCVAGHGAGHERAHQQARDRGVAVGEMEDVGLFLARAFFGRAFSGRRFEVQAIETGIGDGSVVVADCVAINGGDRVDAHSKQVVGVGLEEGKRIRSDFTDLGQEVGVADLAQALDLLFAVESGEIVFLLRCRRERCRGARLPIAETWPGIPPTASSPSLGRGDLRRRWRGRRTFQCRACCRACGQMP